MFHARSVPGRVAARAGFSAFDHVGELESNDFESAAGQVLDHRLHELTVHPGTSAVGKDDCL
jgi:hypothetical protein